MNGWIKAIVLGTKLNQYSHLKGSTTGIQGVKVSCFELREHATALGKERPAITNAEGIVEFNNLGFGFYIVRCNDDPYTDHLIEIDPRTFTPDVKMIKFEANT